MESTLSSERLLMVWMSLTRLKPSDPNPEPLPPLSLSRPVESSRIKQLVRLIRKVFFLGKHGSFHTL